MCWYLRPHTSSARPHVLTIPRLTPNSSSGKSRDSITLDCRTVRLPVPTSSQRFAWDTCRSWCNTNIKRIHERTPPTVMTSGTISLYTTSEEKLVFSFGSSQNKFMETINKIQYLDYQRGLRHDRGQTGTAAKQKGKLDVAAEAVNRMQNRGGPAVLLPRFSLLLVLAWL